MGVQRLPEVRILVALLSIELHSIREAPVHVSTTHTVEAIHAPHAPIPFMFMFMLFMSQPPLKLPLKPGIPIIGIPIIGIPMFGIPIIFGIPIGGIPIMPMFGMPFIILGIWL